MAISEKRAMSRGFVIISILVCVVALLGCLESASSTSGNITIKGDIDYIEAGKSLQLLLKTSISDGATFDVTWSSSDSEIAIVSESGLVTALMPGSTDITVELTQNAEIFDTVTITVVARTSITSVGVIPPAITLAAGGVQTITAAVEGTGNYDPSVTWESGAPSVVDITADGTVTALKEGETEIKAISNADPSFSGIAPVLVTSNNVITDIVVETDSISVVQGSSVTISAEVKGIGEYDSTISWSSLSTDVASVDDGGTITGIMEGSAQIKAVANGDSSFERTISVTVLPKPVISSVEITPAILTIEIGESKTLVAKVDGSGDFLDSVTWESEMPDIVEVDPFGVVVGRSTGTTTVTARADGDKDFFATVEITVVPVPVITDILVSPESLTVEVGKTGVLSASVGGVGSYDDSVTWLSRDPDTATVDASGVVEGRLPGTVEIVVTSAPNSSGISLSDVCVVSVVPAAEITDITLSPSSITLVEGESAQITPTVTGTGNYSTGVIWESKSTTVAEITTNGIVTGKFEGTTTIVAYPEGDTTQSASIPITVEALPSVTSVSISPTEISLDVGTAYTPSHSIVGRGNFDETVEWSSGDPEIASVNAISGEVTPLRPGIVAIRATSAMDPSKLAEIEVTVNGTSGVEIDQGNLLFIGIGMSETLSATVTSFGSATGEVRWSSSSPTSLTFSEDTGELSCFAEGTTLITVTSLDDANINDTIIVQTAKATTMVWDTTKYGSSSSTQLKLPLVSGGEYQFTAYWGDGTLDTIESWNSDATRHTYDTEGVYTVNLVGTLVGWSFNSFGDPAKLLEIAAWGNFDFGSVSSGAFNGCTNMKITAQDSPKFTNTTSLSRVFQNCTELLAVPGIGAWDISSITDLSYMFFGAGKFNGDLSGWIVTSVTDISGLFYNAEEFDSNLTSWKTSSFEDMKFAFRKAKAFNGDLSTWDVSNVFNMQSLFAENTTFNGNITGWNTSGVMIMDYMFAGATEFDRDISGWNISSVNGMYKMFDGVTLPTAIYDAILVGWSGQVTKNGVYFNGGNSKYSANGLTARGILTEDRGWTIVDGGPQYIQ